MDRRDATVFTYFIYIYLLCYWFDGVVLCAVLCCTVSTVTAPRSAVAMRYKVSLAMDGDVMGCEVR